MLGGLRLDPIHIGSIYMIGVNEVFSSHLRVTYEVPYVNSSHVTLYRAHQYLVELPGLASRLGGLPGKQLLLSFNTDNEYQFSKRWLTFLPSGCYDGLFISLRRIMVIHPPWELFELGYLIIW